MLKKEKIKRKRGERVGKNVVKTEIINFILSKNDAVTGLDIKRHLREKYNIVDKNNIEDHLRKLGSEYHCIEQIKPQINGYDNKWIITKIESLQNIREYYPSIQLNRYKKSLNIIFQEQISERFPLRENRTYIRQLRIQLYLSISFFDMCLKNDIKTLFDKADHIYRLEEGFDYLENIKDSINELYTKYISQISVSSDIWLAAYNKNINASLELEFCQNSKKCSSDFGLSKENLLDILTDRDLYLDPIEWKTRFAEEFVIKTTHSISHKMLNKIALKSEKKSEESLKKESIYILDKVLEEIPLVEKDILIKKLNFPQGERIPTMISYEIFQKMLEESPAEFRKISDERFKVWIEVLKKILREVLPKLVEISDEMRQEIRRITLNWILTQINVFETIFKHCFHGDVFDSTVSADEIDFVIMMKNTHSWKERTSAIDTFYIDCFKKMQKETEHS